LCNIGSYAQRQVQQRDEAAFAALPGSKIFDERPAMLLVRQRKLIPSRSPPIPSAQISTSARSGGELTLPALNNEKKNWLIGIKANHIHAVRREPAPGIFSLCVAKYSKPNK